jgi:hypothetical protein
MTTNPPPPFAVFHMSKANFVVARLKAGQNPGEAPAFVFETSCRAESVAERVCRALTAADQAAKS